MFSGQNFSLFLVFLAPYFEQSRHSAVSLCFRPPSFLIIWAAQGTEVKSGPWRFVFGAGTIFVLRKHVNKFI